MTDDELREKISVAIGGVLWNASNYPEKAQVHMLGQDITPLRENVVDAVWVIVKAERVKVWAEGYTRASQINEDFHDVERHNPYRGS